MVINNNKPRNPYMETQRAPLGAEGEYVFLDNGLNLEEAMRINGDTTVTFDGDTIQEVDNNYLKRVSFTTDGDQTVITEHLFYTDGINYYYLRKTETTINVETGSVVSTTEKRPRFEEI